MKILVFLEQRDGRLKDSSLEALSAAWRLNGKSSQDVAGVLIGDQLTSSAELLKGVGASQLFTVEDADLHLYNPWFYAQALAQVVEKFKPDVLLGMASPLGRDLFPRIAARLDAGLLTDLIEIHGEKSFEGGRKPMYAGKVLADLRFNGSAMKMATLRPNVFPKMTEKLSDPLKVEAIPLTKSASPIKTLEIKKGKSAKADLTEAKYIISGGRSLGSAENFAILHECAEVLHATVGASRAAVDSGYATHDMQVGQTGKTVNPSLYIACGISGAIQHMAGMRTAKIIVAINTDPDAPIFSIADYGIVGDLFQVVPVLTKKLKELLH